MIHILGPGAIGLLHATHLLKYTKIPITLIGTKIINPFKFTHQQLNHQSTSFECDYKTSQQIQQPIDRLIVCTKSYDVISSIESIQHQLHEQTIIIILSNGILKILNDLNVYQTKNKNIGMILPGITTHGSIKINSNIVHTGIGFTQIGISDVQMNSRQQQQYEEFMDILTLGWKELNFQRLNDKEIQLKLYWKFCMNCIINPITCLINCKNGFIDYNHCHDLIEPLLNEFLLVFPIMSTFGLTKQSLLNDIYQLCLDTFNNQNSMLVDLYKGRRLELDYLNGFLIEMAKKNSIDVPNHLFLFHAIQSKVQLITKNSHLVGHL
ncbi:ketopantoate reductase PanE/ApbA C terminal-domain-containing protein [Globomyces pollinis-pini]|nr:ketopantoate reductase PanE/ApbA C terminal-domain-containing protein [Globomyces pollinis-pini]